MPRQVAIFIFTLFVVWLWRKDAKFRPHFSKALWIPLIWLLLLGSRPLSWWCWFYFGIGGGGGGSDLEGNALDRLFYSGLIIVSIIIVSRRSFSWGSLIANNLGLVIFYGFLGATILWSEYPFPTTKRWLKELGTIPVLLLILTDRHPVEAIKAVFTRCAYVLFSFSILVIKYVPQVGRDYGSSSGVAQILGIAQQKNSLGEDVAVFGLVLVWQLAQKFTGRPKDALKAPVLQWMIILTMGIWLLEQCGSMTSVLCFALGTLLILTTKISYLEARRKGVVFICLLAVPLFFIVDDLFQISQPVLEMLGRNLTLTNRTEIWQAVREHPVDPILGSGYLNYWDIVGKIDVAGSEVGLKSAHNGYIEVYLDGGYLGVFFLVLMLLHTGARHARAFIHGRTLSDVGFAYFCMTLLMNVSESVFARRGPLWSAFLMVGISWWLSSPTSGGRSVPALIPNELPPVQIE